VVFEGFKEDGPRWGTSGDSGKPKSRKGGGASSLKGHLWDGAQDPRDPSHGHDPVKRSNGELRRGRVGFSFGELKPCKVNDDPGGCDGRTWSTIPCGPGHHSGKV